MYRGEELWRITNGGRKVAKNIRPSGRTAVLDFLYGPGSATLEEIAIHCYGGNGQAARMELKRLARQRLVESGGGGGMPG